MPQGGYTRRLKRPIRLDILGPQGCHPRMEKMPASSGCFPKNIRRRLTRSQKKGVSVCIKNHVADRCLLEDSTLSDAEKESLSKKYLRPKRPSAWASDPDQWLDSNNIADVMKQYEETYTDFKFLGVLPIDFAVQDPYHKEQVGKCLVDTICKLKLAKFKAQGIWRFGAVINLDPHFKDGSHWVGIFVDIRPSFKKVYFFDSYGMKPRDEIARFMRALRLQDSQLKLEYNARRFQLQGSECGMYSMYFIIAMLHNVVFKEFCHVAIPDDVMLKLRYHIFS